MGSIRVGMSGFSYPEWIGDFYPRGTKREGMLSYYASRFGTVEINMTFRRDAAPTTITRWREAVAGDFRFSMKANARITHFRRLVDTKDAVSDFLKRVSGLGPHLGPVLFQVPANLAFDAAVVDAFCADLPAGSLYAFEPRHESFTGTEADEVFRRHGVARCLNDDLFDPATYRVTGSLAYFRFHRSFYERSDIEERAKLVRAIADEGADVYVFFAHEDDPESVRPAIAFQELVTSS